jgi:hypothetical protein
MLQNFGVCPHCTAKGLRGNVWKLTEETPDVTISDGESFHLILFSGPDAVPSPSGGILAGRLEAQFTYVLDRLGTSASQSVVILTRIPETREGVVQQVEKAGQLLAEILAAGKALAIEYIFDGAQLLVSRTYRIEIAPTCPVAIKRGQTEVSAPGHETWGTVTCDSCGDNFYIGPNRFFATRQDEKAVAKRFEDFLSRDHADGRTHRNSYEISD